VTKRYIEEYSDNESTDHYSPTNKPQSKRKSNARPKRRDYQKQNYRAPSSSDKLKSQNKYSSDDSPPPKRARHKVKRDDKQKSHSSSSSENDDQMLPPKRVNCRRVEQK